MIEHTTDDDRCECASKRQDKISGFEDGDTHIVTGANSGRLAEVSHARRRNRLDCKSFPGLRDGFG